MQPSPRSEPLQESYCAPACRSRPSTAALEAGGADVNRATEGGFTPLHIAAQNGQEAAVRRLLEGGADVNRAMKDGATPLFVAAAQGHEAAVRRLEGQHTDEQREQRAAHERQMVEVQHGHLRRITGAVQVAAAAQGEEHEAAVAALQAALPRPCPGPGN